MKLNISSSSNIGQSLECSDAKWFASHESDGRPYISCRTREMLWDQNLYMQVAMQYAAPAYALKILRQSKLNSLDFTICKNEAPNPMTGDERAYYGRPGQLCSEVRKALMHS